MYVQFEFTHDDFVDACKRFSTRFKLVRSSQLRTTLSVAFFAALLSFLILYRTPIIAAIIALAAAVASILFYRNSIRRAYEKHFRLLSKDIFGDASSFLCEVELRPEGVWVRQGHHQVVHEWPSIEEISETPDSVDIFTRDKSGVVIRNRAFKSPEERLRFIELTRGALRSANLTPPARESF